VTGRAGFARSVAITLAVLIAVIAAGLGLAAALSPDGTPDSGQVTPRPASMPGPPVRSGR
jgi:hypothetical protein